MKSDEQRDPFAGLHASAAPERLKSRVLQAAARAPRVSESPANFWERLWESRPLRAAWALTLLALLVAHVALSVPSGTDRPTSAQASRGGNQREELRELLALPVVEISPSAERMALGTPARLQAEPISEDSKDIEVES